MDVTMWGWDAMLWGSYILEVIICQGPAHVSKVLLVLIQKSKLVTCIV